MNFVGGADFKSIQRQESDNNNSSRCAHRCNGNQYFPAARFFPEYPASALSYQEVVALGTVLNYHG